MTETKSALAKLTDAVRMLAEVKTVQDAEKLIGLAEAARVYAQQNKLGIVAENHAVEIKIRAARKAGEILDKLDLHKGKPKTKCTPPGTFSLPPTLPDLDISRKQSSLWQKIAAIPEVAFEEKIATVGAKNERLTTAGILQPGQHPISQSNSNEWFTPHQYIDAARTVMGSIDLDPASNDIAQEWIRATTYYTKEDNGLVHEWHGRVWLNPPYGKLVGTFVAKLAEEIAVGHVLEAVVLVNAHSTDASWFSPLWNGLLCFTNHRINFIAPGGEVASGSTHGNVFVYFGPKQEEFIRNFAQWGTVVRAVTP